MIPVSPVSQNLGQNLISFFGLLLCGLYCCAGLGRAARHFFRDPPTLPGSGVCPRVPVLGGSWVLVGRSRPCVFRGAAGPLDRNPPMQLICYTFATWLSFGSESKSVTARSWRTVGAGRANPRTECDGSEGATATDSKYDRVFLSRDKLIWTDGDFRFCRFREIWDKSDFLLWVTAFVWFLLWCGTGARGPPLFRDEYGLHCEVPKRE